MLAVFTTFAGFGFLIDVSRGGPDSPLLLARVLPEASGSSPV
jgi:hypothetical protein